MGMLRLISQTPSQAEGGPCGRPPYNSIDPSGVEHGHAANTGAGIQNLLDEVRVL